MSDVDFRDNAGWANENFKADNSGRLVILFHAVQKHMKKASIDQNRPVFEERIHITKIVPGDTRLVIDRPIREEDKEEYADRWAHWLQTRQNRPLGFPIESWHSISETQKAEFKARKIDTVEQFAALSDGIIQTIMGGTELRQKARVFIEAGKDAELVAKIKADASAEVMALQDQVAKLTAMVEQMTAPTDEAKSTKKEKVVA